jgi:hypothetical protein
MLNLLGQGNRRETLAIANYHKSSNVRSVYLAKDSNASAHILHENRVRVGGKD